MKSLLSILSAALGVTALQSAQVTMLVPDDTEFELSPVSLGDNFATNTLKLGSGCTLKLMDDGNGGGAPFEIAPIILGTNGAFTVDATALTTYSGLRWSNHVWSDGVITVKGTDRVLFGFQSTSIHSTAMMTAFRTGMTFVDADGEPYAAPGGVTFTNSVTLLADPVCPWRIAAGTWFAPAYPQALGTPGETVELTDWNLCVVKADAIAASRIRVGNGCEMSIHLCTIGSNDDFFKWGASKGTFTNDVELAGGDLWFDGSASLTVNNAITGAGCVRPYGTGTFTVKGNVDFDGTWNFYGDQLVVGVPALDSVVYSHSKRGRILFRPTGYDKSNTVCRIEALTGLSDVTNAVNVQKNQTIEIGSLTGRFRFESTVPNTAAVVERASANAVIRVPDGLDFTLLDADAGVTLILANDNGTGRWTIRGPESDEHVPATISCTTENASLALDGRLALTGLPSDLAAVDIAAGADVTGDFPLSCAVHSNGGRWSANETAWQRKLALWTDADCPESFIYCTDCNADITNDSHKIFWWRDRRPAQTNFTFAMYRFPTNSTSNIHQYPVLYPTVVPDGLNGRPILSFSGSQQTRLGVLPVGTPLNNQNSNSAAMVPSRFAIVVARCVDESCGMALLGSYNDELASSKKGYNGYLFTNETLTVYKNGSALPDYRHTTWGKSEWAIYSFTTDEAQITGLSLSVKESTTARGGGFDYAEVMIFSEMPTDVERMQIEEYLSAKWGLAVGHAGTLQDLDLSGSGATTLQQPTRLNGVFMGTVDLNGNRLEIAEALYPPSEAEIPSEGRAMWHDPSLANSVALSDDPLKPLEVAHVLPRDNAGIDMTSDAYYLQSAIKGSTDRRPHYAAGARGGSAAAWIDFANHYADVDPNDVNANNLMIRKLPVETPLAKYDASGYMSVTYRTAFMVMDTSRGGGTPICHYAGATTGDTIRRGAPPVVTDPIWNASCTDIIKNGRTWLDGSPVDGLTQGFSGRPELLTFEPATAGGTKDATNTQVKAIGCLSTANTLNQEIIGETLFYSTQLDDATRANIEAYLMKKWFGTARAGYADFRDMTVTGAGTLIVPSAKAMPRLADDFTGTVELATNHLDFTFTPGATTATEALLLGDRTFAAPAETVVNASFPARPAAGSYLLLTGTVADTAGWRLGTVANVRAARLRYESEEKALYLDVIPSGTVIIAR